MILVLLLPVSGITTTQQLLVPYLVHLTLPQPQKISVLRTGIYQATILVVQQALLIALPANLLLFPQLPAAATTMVRSAMLRAGAGGPLLRTIVRIGATCITVVVVWKPTSTTVSTGSTSAVRVPRSFSGLHWTSGRANLGHLCHRIRATRNIKERSPYRSSRNDLREMRLFVYMRTILPRLI